MDTFTNYKNIILGSITFLGITSNIISLIVTSSCKKTYDTITYLTTNTNSDFNDIKNFIRDNDLLNKITRIDYYLNNNKIEKDIYYNHLTEIIEDINNLLIKIKDAEEYQNSLYFKKYRNIDCSLYLKELQSKINILNIRYDEFIKIHT